LVGTILWATGDTAGGAQEIEKALHVSKRLGAPDAASPSARLELARDYMVLGFVQGMLSTRGNLGRFDEAFSNQRSAQAIFERLLLENPGNKEFRRSLASCDLNLGDALMSSGHHREALPLLRKSLEYFESAAKEPNNTSAQRTLSNICQRIGLCLKQTRRPERVPSLLSEISGTN
jgi:tetratricopeptide (TPR) repeat protein